MDVLAQFRADELELSFAPRTALRSLTTSLLEYFPAQDIAQELPDGPLRGAPPTTD